jgi:hypothetical protein
MRRDEARWGGNARQDTNGVTSSSRPAIFKEVRLVTALFFNIHEKFSSLEGA